MAAITHKKSNLGLWIASAFGFVGVGIVAMTVPFLRPAFRRYCLPYLPATDDQLNNLTRAFEAHAVRNMKFLDIGSGDGRICRLAATKNLFSEVHGVEINYILVLASRLSNKFVGNTATRPKYFCKDLWFFPLGDYENLCIFGVDVMMKPLEEKLVNTRNKTQIVFACRFPFEGFRQIDQFGEGIDTVWVYKL